MSKVKKKQMKSDNTDIFLAEVKDDNNNDNIDSINSTNTKTIEQKYQKKTQIEHILLRPDTYVGDISIQQEMMWIWDESSNKIIKKEIKYVPGLYKIFDEVLVNARDHNCNDPSCDTIKVNIDQEEGMISVWNNGKGIDIVEHAEHNMYIPEMLFGELLTSTNYDDNDKRTTGGRNGYGAKLTNVFSSFFSIETVDGERKLKFYQEFTNNLSNRTKPKITKLSSEKPSTFTKITFKPDLEKFKLKRLSNDIIGLLSKRVIDMAGITNKVKIYLNDKKVDINNFKKYINLYEFNSELNNKDEAEEAEAEDDEDDSENSKKEEKDNIIYEESSRWKVGIIYDPEGNFEQISFVNGICTYHGGNHVDYVLNQIIKKIEVIILKKFKEAKIKSNTIKENLVIFLDTVIDNPAFTSQTKETLKSKASDFGSSYEPSDKLIKKLASTGIIDQIINMAKIKEESFLKKTDGKKTTSVKGIPKLEDANWAGDKKKAIQCKLILTEGDSAKALAMAGRSVVGSDKYGVFPLKGKLLNVRDAIPKQLLENEEIINIKKILGLQHNKEYHDLNELRYGGIILMTDQDSVTGDTPLLLKKNNIIEITTIDKIGDNWELDQLNNKYYGTTDYEIWSDKGWTPIRKVIKHTVNKKIFRVLTHTGLVDVTEDHSLLDPNGNEVTPNNINIGDKLLHEPLLFDVNKIDIPEDLNSMSISNLHKLASTLKIKEYQTYRKENLINLINVIKNKYYHVFPVNNYDISNEEAYKMGLCFADDTEVRPDKRVPIEILNNTFEVREQFFNGYYDGDGSKHETEKFFDVNSKITAQGLFILSRSLGYQVSINHNIKKPSVYTLTLTKGHQQFEKTQIKKIIDLGVQNCIVYDLETENHHFQAGIGSMIVHNTDGFHIKGLLMNFFHYFWPSLLQHHEFITALATPIIKATRKTKLKNRENVKVFYNLTDYDNWKNDPDAEKFTIKYYKGLGTSTKEEAKEYFEDIETKLIKYIWKPGSYDEPDSINNINNMISTIDEGEEDEVNKEDEEDIIIEEIDDETIDDDELEDTEVIRTKKVKTSKVKSKAKELDISDSTKDVLYKKVLKNHRKIFGVCNKYENDCTEAITLAFEKKRANCRKTWLRNYNKDRVMSNDLKSVPIPDFIHKELIHFSNDDINRSIPSLIDGLKPSTRKILYGTILRKLNSSKDEIKVAQLSGFVSDKAHYHHGEASLNGAIIGMAQNFVGSNNINILYPSGQFGTKLLGGKDFASPRYIFTYLAELTRLIFRPEDDPILNYLNDDGYMIEPEWYCPIIPMVLVNGAEGIGTGFSTYITQYNPLDLVENIKLLMNNQLPKPLMPYYRNFKGLIEQIKPNEFTIKGCYQKIGQDKIKITELPIGTWITPYKEVLEKKTEKVKNHNPLIESYKSNGTDETVDFTIKMDQDVLSKLENNNQIYTKFKLIKSLKLSNMHLYSADGQIKKYDNPNEILMEFYETRLLMYTKRKEYLIGKLLKELDILKWKKLFIEKVLDNTIIIYRQKKNDIINKLIELEFPKLAKLSDTESDTDENTSYDYITDIPLFNLTQEKIDELNERYNNKEQELFKIQSTSEIEQWNYELDEFTDKYKKWIITHSNLDNKVTNKRK